MRYVWRLVGALGYTVLASLSLTATAQEAARVTDFTKSDLFALKSTLEAQIESDFVHGVDAKTNGEFNFLIGEWDLVRTSFGADGNVASRTKGTAVARYTFEGRAIQEDFYNYSDDGTPYRGGTALYTYSPSSMQWHVAAVDASTGATAYQPMWVDGEVHYESVVRLPDREIYTKSRIFGISKDTTEWEQAVSIDNVDWFPNYHIINHRRQ